MKKRIVVMLLCSSLLLACGTSVEYENAADSSFDSTLEIISEEFEETLQTVESEDATMGEDAEPDFLQDTCSDMDYKDLDYNEIIAEEKTPWDAWSFVASMNIGWNLGDALGASAKVCGYDANLNLENNWGNPTVSKELIDYVASLGFNTIRIPVSWCYNCGRDEQGHLVVGEQWMQRVHEVVDYAVDNDLNIILNSMCDSWELFRCGVEEEQEWEQVKTDCKDLWTQIANSFEGYDKHLAFEPYNEVDNAQQGFTYSELSVNQMNELNQVFVDTVRATGGNNSERILLIPTLFHSTMTNVLDAFILPQDSVKGNLAVTVHSYEGEFDQDIEWKFEVLEDLAARLNAPIIIGEFGARDDYTPIEYREIFTANYIARAIEKGIKCCIWDDGYHWKLIDRYDFDNTDNRMLDAIFEGVAGKSYHINEAEKIILNSMDDFYFGSLNWDSRKIELVDYEHKYWATLTTKTADNEFLEIEDGKYVCVSMTTKNAAVNFWIYYLYFMDENFEQIGYKVDKSPIHRFVCAEIPEGVKYLVVNTYDPYDNHTLEQIQTYMEAGDLEMRITFVD